MRATLPWRVSSRSSVSAISGAQAASWMPTTAMTSGGVGSGAAARLAASWPPMLRVSSSAKSGELRISASKSERPSVTSHVSRTARTEAERRPACSSASSPSTSPRLSVRMTVSGGPSATTSSRPMAIT